MARRIVSGSLTIWLTIIHDREHKIASMITKCNEQITKDKWQTRKAFHWRTKTQSAFRQEFLWIWIWVSIPPQPFWPFLLSGEISHGKSLCVLLVQVGKSPLSCCQGQGSTHLRLFNKSNIAGPGTLTQWLNPCLIHAGMPYGHQILSQLLCFLSSPLPVAWESNTG